MISLSFTAAPRPLKNCPTTMSEVLMGRDGKKYLVVSNGENNETPTPPLVIASGARCEVVARKQAEQRPPSLSAVPRRASGLPGCGRRPHAYPADRILAW